MNMAEVRSWACDFLANATAVSVKNCQRNKINDIQSVQPQDKNICCWMIGLRAGLHKRSASESSRKESGCRGLSIWPWPLRPRCPTSPPHIPPDATGTFNMGGLQAETWLGILILSPNPQSLHKKPYTKPHPEA